MIEFVITRPAISRKNSIESRDRAQRRPYFANANTPEEAKDIVRKRYNIPVSEPLDCETLETSVFCLPRGIK